MSKQELISLLNKALELEHAAHVQYLSHSELVEGLNAEPIIGRLKEIANDEKSHQEKFRALIGALGGTPSMEISATKSAKTIREILEKNLESEKEAVDVYSKIMDFLRKDPSKYYGYLLEHEVRHIIMEEQEHITELEVLLEQSGESY